MRLQQAATVVLCVAALASTAALEAQTKAPAVPDAQVQSNVLKALAGAPRLASEQIRSSTVLGVVTLSGAVRDEATRSLAEDVVSRTAGVTKVIDELTLGGSTSGSLAASNTQPPAAGASAPEPGDASGQGSNPLLQSDGTIASSPADPDEARSDRQPMSEQPPDSVPAAPNAAQAPPYPSQSPYPAQQPSNGQPYPQQPPYPQQRLPSKQQAPYGQQPVYDAGSPYGSGSPQQQGYGQQPPPPYGPQSPYPGQRMGYPGQAGGQPVTVPAGTLVQVRFDQGLDSRHTAVGSTFSGTILRDVTAGGLVALPRGATVHGQVVNAESSGALKGRAELALQLTEVTLAGQSYPLVSRVWSLQGGNKAVRSVDSAVGLGVLGAIIGGVAGGGAGAAIGAGAGGAAGLGASAASGSSQVIVPPESIVAFQLTQQANLSTVSQAELNRLSYRTPYAPYPMGRRYAPPPPYAYGPGPYYPYPRYYRVYPY